jgi:uncharacterized protein (UPF0261 family)
MVKIDMKKTIVLVGALDTKAEESLYIKNLIEVNNYQVTTIDVGTGWRGELIFPPDYAREEVAKIAGSSIEEILSMGESGQENRMMELMARGAIRICQQLYESGKFHGIISVGGTMGTSLGTRIMRALPFGLPKVMLSTIASGDTRPYIGTKDIVMISSIADIAGLNRITEVTLRQAAGAVMGMTSVGEGKASVKPLIGITTLGGTTNCALHIKKGFEGKGYETVIFHANGCGGRAMEEMIEQGMIHGVFDLSPNEIVDHLYQGWSDAGSTRMEEAGKRGIPQLVSPGNIDHIIYSREDQIPERFRHQYIHRHGPSILVLRTKRNEMIEVGKVMAEKLNRAKGPTAVILPLKGLSILDKTVEEFNDPESNNAFFDSLSGNLNPNIEIRRVDAHITDTAFAEEAERMLSGLLRISDV